jgi:transcriptional regulator with XRE-family HTH domain
MPRRKKLDLENIRTTRKLSGMNQYEFWSRYGITQSGGSRYESGRCVPKPAAMLIWLRESGVITEQHLRSALKAVA